MTEEEKKKNQKGKISRRDFVKGAGLVIGGAAALGVGGITLTGCGEKKPWLPDKWDYEADVVVVGFGAAGAPAAICAHDDGAKVLVLEKMPVAGEYGSSAATSGGYIWIPNNSYAEAAGIQDSREDALTYLNLIAEGQADEELILTYLDRGNEVIEYIDKNTPLVIKLSIYPDYHAEWPGGKIGARSLIPEVYKGKAGGQALMLGLFDATQERNIEIMLETSGRKLVQDSETKEILGIIAESKGKEVYIKARKAVILAAGGFEWNEEMVRHFLRGPTPLTTNIPNGSTGDGIKMAMDVGADLRLMNECWGMPIFKEQFYELTPQFNPTEDYKTIAYALLSAFISKAKPGNIMVNRYGERFYGEGFDYDTIWRSFFTWEILPHEARYRNIPAYMVFDSQCFSNYGLTFVAPPGGTLPAWVKKADTLQELALKFGIDPDGLDETVTRFNEYAKQLKDPDFHRGESAYGRYQGDPSIEGPGATLAPLETPPFYGAEVGVGNIGTCGGPRINRNAQVLDVFGKVIPRLYAAGNNAGVGGPGASYGGAGGTIGPAAVFGHIAGEHAAALSSWD